MGMGLDSLRSIPDGSRAWERIIVIEDQHHHCLLMWKGGGSSVSFRSPLSRRSIARSKYGSTRLEPVFVGLGCRSISIVCISCAVDSGESGGENGGDGAEKNCASSSSSNSSGIAGGAPKMIGLGRTRGDGAR